MNHNIQTLPNINRINLIEASLKLNEDPIEKGYTNQNELVEEVLNTFGACPSSRSIILGMVFKVLELPVKDLDNQDLRMFYARMNEYYGFVLKEPRKVTLKGHSKDEVVKLLENKMKEIRNAWK